MALTRRSALRAMSALGLLPLAAASPARAAPEREVYLSAYMDGSGAFGSAVLEADGTVLARHALPDRGHGAAVRPTMPHGVQFARRPGRFAVIYDWRDGNTVTTIHAADDRHFYGHGVYSPDGTLLYATENDISGERGVIGIYDAERGYERLGEVPSHGIGPHQMVLMADGETLAIANGGILTDPGLPRLKLNLADMDPNLSLVDRRTGELLRQLRPPADLHRLSLRHLDARADGTIALAAQWEGPEAELPPLVGLVSPDGDLRLMDAPDPVQRVLQNYCGSVAFNRAGTRFAVSAPRGNTIMFWNADGSFAEALDLADGCGLAAHGGGFVLTSGMGIVMTEGPDAGQPGRAPLAWDNHLLRV